MFQVYARARLGRKGKPIRAKLKNSIVPLPMQRPCNERFHIDKHLGLTREVFDALCRLRHEDVECIVKIYLFVLRLFFENMRGRLSRPCDRAGDEHGPESSRFAVVQVIKKNNFAKK